MFLNRGCQNSRDRDCLPTLWLKHVETWLWITTMLELVWMEWYTTLINQFVKGHYETVPAKELPAPLWVEAAPATRCDAAKPCPTTIKTMGLWFWWFAIYFTLHRLEPCLGRRWIAVCLPLSEGFYTFGAPPRDPWLTPKRNLIGHSFFHWFEPGLNQPALRGPQGGGGGEYIAIHLRMFFAFFHDFLKKTTTIVDFKTHQTVFNRISCNDPYWNPYLTSHIPYWANP